MTIVTLQRGRRRRNPAFPAGVLILAAAAEDAGWFAEGARLAARAAGGSSRRLFSASVDRRAPRGVAAEPLLYACIAVANTGSLARPVSNPTNVIVVDPAGY